VSRKIPSGHIEFGSKYEPEKLRRLVEHTDRMTAEIQRLQALLVGGLPGQTLVKLTPKDYAAQWGTSAATTAVEDGNVLLFAPDANFPSGRVLEAGPNITISISPAGKVTISGTFGGSGSASGDASFLTLASDPSLPNERVFTAGHGLIGTDAGPGGSFTLEVDDGTLVINWPQVINAPPLYMVQPANVKFWLKEDFLHGENIIGVQFPGPAVVYLPHDLEIEKIIDVKDEAGVGPLTVRIY
jgi:hypothetical protein